MSGFVCWDIAPQEQHFRSELYNRAMYIRLPRPLIHGKTSGKLRAWCPHILANRGIPSKVPLLSDQGPESLENQSSPPASAVTPRFTSGKAKVASSLAITMSQLRTSSVPPPYALPFTAAIMGLGEDDRREIAPKPFERAMNLSCSSPSPSCVRSNHLRKPYESSHRIEAVWGRLHAFKSAPAQKTRPWPVTITTLGLARFKFDINNMRSIT